MRNANAEVGTERDAAILIQRQFRCWKDRYILPKSSHFDSKMLSEEELNDAHHSNDQQNEFSDDRFSLRKLPQSYSWSDAFVVRDLEAISPINLKEHKSPRQSFLEVEEVHSIDCEEMWSNSPSALSSIKSTKSSRRVEKGKVIFKRGSPSQMSSSGAQFPRRDLSADIFT